MTDDELMEIAMPFAADGERWPSDWLAAMRAAAEAEREACKRDCIAVIESRHLTGQLGFNAIHDCLERISKRSNVELRGAHK